LDTKTKGAISRECTKRGLNATTTSAIVTVTTQDDEESEDEDLMI
jgi:hypothetical protein